MCCVACKNIKNIDWICFCPDESKSAKERLIKIYNSWLSEYEIKKAKELGNDPNVTEEEAVSFIAKLEESANGAKWLWEFYQ